MFGLFDKKDPNRCPITEENRVWLESSFSLLLNIFDNEKIKQRAILIPHHSDFQIKYNGETQTAIETLKIVAKQMEVEFDEIELNFYDEGVREISTGSSFGGGRIFLNSFEDEAASAGLYFGK